MSTVHSSNRHYREEFEPARPAVVLPVWVAAGITAAFAFISMHAGAWLERQVTPAPEVRVIGMACPKPPLTQWTCDGRERAEYAEACKRRALSALTKPKE